jgi:hypothetical protein
MSQVPKYFILAAGVAISYFAQEPPRATPKSMHEQSASTVSLTAKGDEQILEINNVTYDVADAVPGRPPSERLLLRKTIRTRQVAGDIGEEASTTLEAWPLGVDLKQNPLYTLKVEAAGGATLDNVLFVADRGLEEVAWWSVYRLGTGRHLFDTYVPLLSFSISREIMESRYVGLEVPPDNASDARLRKPNVVGVLTYASGEKVKREILLTCDMPDQAALLRSYADTTRTLTVAEGRPPRALKLRFESNDPSLAAPIVMSIPLAGDDLDLIHTQLPPHLHVAAWKR